jgi:magnesium transporter
MLVGFGLDEQLHEPVEVHCYYTTGFLITLRRAPSPALDDLRQAGSVQPQLGSDPIRALHPLVSSLYTQFSALALELNERLDALEQQNFNVLTGSIEKGWPAFLVLGVD